MLQVYNGLLEITMALDPRIHRESGSSHNVQKPRIAVNISAKEKNTAPDPIGK
jgi:hypothetical protein